MLNVRAGVEGVADEVDVAGTDGVADDQHIGEGSADLQKKKAESVDEEKKQSTSH
jgi:hypothetical protein